MSGWTWSGKWRCRTPGYSDPGSPEGPAPSLWEQKGGVSAGRRLCLLPAAGLPCRLCTTRRPRGARGPFPQSGPCDQTPRQARPAPLPQPAGFVLQQEGGRAAPAPTPPWSPGAAVLAKKRVCPCSPHSFRGGIQGHSAGGACSDAPAGRGRETRVGRGLRPSGLQSRGHNRSKVATGCPRSAGATRPAACLCVRVRLGAWPSSLGGRAGGRSLSGEEPTAGARRLR